MQRLDLVVGPNGAGKTTFVRKTLMPVLPPGAVFVNADEIARRRWPEDPEGNSYEAAKVAEATRAALIEVGQPFIAETVFSHPSKLELIDTAHAAVYTVFLHVLLVPEDLSVARVAYRVAAGGHSVPEEKIRQRHRRLWRLVAVAMARADAATVYDNASNEGPRIAAQVAGGVAVGVASWPPWVPAELVATWPSS
ncbi:MAG TPA: AAA family ATPase [Nocardioidaceae bacterium]|nr:AAA family ATPase [Nocardioidaceae bacterium]